MSFRALTWISVVFLVFIFISVVWLNKRNKPEPVLISTVDIKYKLEEAKEMIKQGNPEGYYVMGQWLETGLNRKKALEYYQKAASSGNINAYSKLAEVYYRSELKNVNQARYYSTKACEKNDGRGCEILGELYYGGEGVPMDEKRAIFYFEKACRNAYNQGFSYGCGRWFLEKQHETTNFLDEKCNHGSKNACFTLGVLYRIPSVTQKNNVFYRLGGESLVNKNALSYFKKACDLGYQKGCSEAKSLQDNLKE
ncbi:tetratricopeptide repeat protein [Helicobacter cetorum]|uniref:tetratricopeptide repeat protein n=1 Tax=Helicobacter cetorum TaxID=138563 RepID=UPI000CF130F0|nr:tetratricopeptide repeat protein [Helicobacter cetorum]